MTDAASVPAQTWGPFNGRQLTTIIVALVTVIFFPSAAWAVDTFSNVAIQDPVSGAKAAVDSSRRLQVNGSVSGSSVYALPRPPGTPWSFAGIAQYGFTGLAGPTAVPINLTSFSFGFSSGSATNMVLNVYSVPSTSTSCSFNTYRTTMYRIGWVSSSSGPFDVAFPTPIVARPAGGEKLCLYVYNEGDATLTMNAGGYFSA